MAFNDNGVFTMPTGATDAFPGKVISSTDWNNINTQVQAALTSLGQGAPYVLGTSAVAVPLTGGTAETALATISVPAGTMGANGLLRITAYWSYTNNGNNKTFRARLGGLAGTQFYSLVTTTALNTRITLEIWNRNSAASQVGSQAGVALQTGTVNTALVQSLVLTGQLANGADTIQLEGYTVEVFRRT